MRFTRKAIAFMAFLLAACFALPLLSPMEASASIPSRRIIRVGLTFGSTALPSGNLVNAVGSGFEFGYYDSNLNFTAVASTSEKSISVMVDRNLQWNSSAEFSGQFQLTGNNGLNAPSSGSTFIGFAHVQMNSGRPTLAEAQNDLGGRSDGFIRYNAGSGNPFVPMFGNYTSSAQADANRGSGTANTGTARTITVATLGKNKILFEFDNSSNTNLIFGIRPMNDARPSTHYRGYRYYGGFRFDRPEATKLTVVNIVGLEDYVMGVVPYEMSASWPLEALKAQAICARTYVLAQLNKYSSYGFDVCTTASSQVYRGLNSANATTDSAVTQTAGQVVTYNGSLISTYYSSSHGGGSENNENIWAGTALPYLRGVLDNYEDSISSSISQYNWTLAISQSEITQRVRNAGHSNASTIASLRVSQYSPTGNVISVIARDTNGREYTFSRRAGLQSLFGATALRSQRFNIGSVVWTPGGTIFVNSPAQSIALNEYSVRFGVGTGTGTSTVSGSLSAIDGSDNIVSVVGGGGGVTAGTATGPVSGNFILTGRGWGHSVGMSQWGANAQARHYGRTAEQIIKHYYTGVVITKIS